jgi:hypothetical protein
MPNKVRVQIKERLDQFLGEIEAKVEQWLGVRDAAAFRAMELDVHAMGREIGDAITARVLHALVRDMKFQLEASVAARAETGMRSGGRRTVKVTLLGGDTVTVEVEYIKPSYLTTPGRRRRTRGRGRGGAGCYPVLAALGIAFGVTPALGGEVCRQIADSDSVRAGRAALDRRGIDLGHQRTLRIVNHFSHRAVAQRNSWLERARQQPAARGPLSRRRVVIATDGGRLRERKAKPGRRNAKTGHHRYDAPWREPKLLTIYAVDQKGRVSETFTPVYDGTLGDCDAVFAMLLGYLKALGAKQASELMVLGDGAVWIWERVDALASELGINRDRITQVVDWCHAVQTLFKIAEARSHWNGDQKESWIRMAKRHLHAGEIDKLLAAIDELAVGRAAKGVLEHRDYFDRNRDRMQYAAFEGAGIPTGSGAIESAIRRIVNMRLKSNAMFWKETNAEGMLLLRSYLKAGHFESLVDWSSATAATWWPPHAPRIDASPLTRAAS